MSEPIARHGGEILKFIGDGLLAIFPLSEPSACANLLHAVADARRAMAALNEKNSDTGRAPLNYGIGVHVGDVMYGNIGSATRLDFTVIGPAVNMASRLETLTKQLGRTVLLSRAFADSVGGDFDLERVRRISGPRLQRSDRAVCLSRVKADGDVSGCVIGTNRDFRWISGQEESLDGPRDRWTLGWEYGIQTPARVTARRRCAPSDQRL
jgi:class 3 adenylate cyclase